MQKSKIITNSKILFGKPRINGTRISVEQVILSLASGMTNKEICKEFEIQESDIQACLQYAHSSLARTHISYV